MSPNDFECLWKFNILNQSVDENLKGTYEREFLAYVSHEGAMCSVLVENADNGQEKILAALTSAFISPAFLSFIESSREPFVCRHLAGWIEHGQSPLLSYENQASQSSELGLDMLVMEWTWDRSLSEEKQGEVKSLLLSQYVDRYSGMNIRSILAEPCIPEIQAILVTLKFELLNPYEEWNSKFGNPGKFFPKLFKLYRTVALKEISDRTLLDLFRWQKPKCKFTNRQLDVLERVRLGDPIDQISKELGLGRSHERTILSQIYETIRQAYPGELLVADLELRRELREFLIRHPWEVVPGVRRVENRKGRPRRLV